MLWVKTFSVTNDSCWMKFNLRFIFQKPVWFNSLVKIAENGQDFKKFFRCVSP